MTVRHIETGIAEKNDLGQENKEAKFYWCGARVNKMAWSFTDATHALLALKRSTSVQPCHDCLKAILGVIERELW